MARPAFTLIEILVTILVIGIIASLTIRSGLATQQQAVFQANFQEVVLAMQDLRSKALANTDDNNKGYGFEVRINDNVNTRIITTYVDKNGDKFYTNGTDEIIKEIDLSNNDAFRMGRTAYRYIEDAATFDTSDGTQVDSERTSVYFPSNKLKCELIAYNAQGNVDLSYVELVFGGQWTEWEWDEDLGYAKLVTKGDSRTRYLSVHHVGCIPETSNESLL